MSPDAKPCTKCGNEPRDPGQRWGKRCRSAARALSRKPRPPGPPPPPEIVAEKRKTREQKRRATNAQKRWEKHGVPPALPETPGIVAPVLGDPLLAAQQLYRAVPYDAAAADNFLALMAAGYSQTKACKYAHVSRASINNWVTNNIDNMAERYAAARLLQLDYWADEGKDIADDGENDTYVDDQGRQRVNTDVIQRSRLRVEQRRWMLERLRPEVYGPKVQATPPQTQNVFVIALNNPTRDPLARGGESTARVIEASPSRPVEAAPSPQGDDTESVLDFRGVLDRPRERP